MVNSKQLMATMIVFSVLITQTLLVKLAFETNPESFGIVLGGFIIADVIAACTYGIFSD